MRSVGADVTEVHLDEAGYTGPDLVNLQQPVFVLASVVLGEEEARDHLAACFDIKDREELKHSRLCKSRRGRGQILELLRRMEPTSGKIAFYGAHKEYVALGFLIDFWFEPLARLEGINLYEGGANIGLVNASFVTLQAVLGLDGRRELLRRFQVMTRDRTVFAYDSFWDSLRELVQGHELIRDSLGPLLIAERRFGWKHLRELPENLLDLGDYGLLETVSHWQAALPGHDFVLIHDQSRMIETRRRMWEAVLDPNNPRVLVGQDRRTTSFPLPVRGLRTEDSRSFPQLQVADIVAGAVCAVLRARATGTESEYIRELVKLGIANAAIGGPWPSTAVTPEELETEGPVYGDAAGFIAKLVTAHERLDGES